MKHLTQALILAITATALLAFSPVVVGQSVYAKHLCKLPDYSCFKAKKHDSWESLWPNSAHRHIIKIINRTNVPLYRGIIIAVPNNLTSSSSNPLDYGPFKRQIPSHGEKVIIFDPSVLAWAAYDANGQLARWGAASGGAHWCEDVKRSCRTPSGQFRIFSKGGTNCKSTKYPLPNGGAKMPHCMFFYRGFGFHGSPGAVPGYHASHGCTRLFVQDAKWLNREFIELPNSNNNYRGTKVIVRAYSNNYAKQVWRDRLVQGTRVTAETNLLKSSATITAVPSLPNPEQ